MPIDIKHLNIHFDNPEDQAAYEQACLEWFQRKLNPGEQRVLLFGDTSATVKGKSLHDEDYVSFLECNRED
jgi:hypothetical protein